MKNQWPLWEKHRHEIESPNGMINKADLVRAQENLQRYAWARQYLNDLQNKTVDWKRKISPEFLENFIPEITPGNILFNPCPACRVKGKAYLPHGNWKWEPTHPDQVLCQVCQTTFPDANYPETVKVQTTWGKPQTFSFIGGEPFEIFGYQYGRPSFTGAVRAHKVVWMSDLVRDLAEVYALSKDPTYAGAVKEILLRFATVYPTWLVHVGYGEYADMDPGTAAEKMNFLPEDETVYPPNRPNRKLHTGYWSAGRARSEGMEGRFVEAVATAYDLTRNATRVSGQPVYSEADRLRIEKDLLLEGTKLLVEDPVINNKSITNRSAAGIVGMVLGEPDLVRVGMEGFFRTVNDWFLPDGGTPESPHYGWMALGAILGFSQALRGYSDPPGYTDTEGKRFDHFNPYENSRFQKVLNGMFNTLQGDLKYPPFTDSYVESKMTPRCAELMADNYPETPEYLALLKAVLKGDWEKPYAPYAIYWAEPGREKAEIPPLRLPSYCFPDLRLGFLRTGKDGRESLLMLSASHYGGHHHLDSLNLSYWKQGQELLSDLGYLWDHPDSEMTWRTLAHNTVLIDEKDQIADGRGGTIKYFVDEPHVKAIRASSEAYPGAKQYERAAILVDHGNGQNYVVDVFWVQGGSTQDYVYHGPNSHWELVEPEIRLASHNAMLGEDDPLRVVRDVTPPGLTEISPSQPESPFSTTDKNAWRLRRNPSNLQGLHWKTADTSIYDLNKVRRLLNPEQQIYGLRWHMADAQEFTVWHLPQSSEAIFVGEGWGKRNSNNPEQPANLPTIVGSTLPYIVRRREGDAEQTFVSVMEMHPQGQLFVRKITPLTVKGDPSQVTVLQVDTSVGRDYVVVSRKPGQREVVTPDGPLKTNALMAVLSVDTEQIRFRATDCGTMTLVPKKAP